MCELTFFYDDDKERVFSAKQPLEKMGNQHEYEFFIQVLAVLKDYVEGEPDGKPYFFGDLPPDYMKHRFLPANPPSLIREQDVDSFPDAVLVSDEVIVIVDHFQVDASKQIIKNGQVRGTEYSLFLGKKPFRDENDWKCNIEKRAQKEGIEFRPQYLADNLKYSFTKKIEKVGKPENYETTVRAHIRQHPRTCTADLKKPMEVWFLIEDISPTSGFGYICSLVASLLEQHPMISGIIFVHNAIPELIKFTAGEVVVIRNDSLALSSLRGLSA